MRVDIVESIPERRGGMGQASEDSAVKLALKNFQNAMQSDDSLLQGHQTEAGPVFMAEPGGYTCSGDFVLTFRGEELGRDRGTYSQLIQKLSELLKHGGSQDVLTAKLCLISGEPKEIPGEAFALRIQLEAVGDSSEQAALRWGLGLAQLQQALLFTSRHLRQQISQKSG